MKKIKQKKNKNNIGKYLARYKIWIFLYTLLTILASVCDIFSVILMARTIEIITLSQFKRAMSLLFIIIGVNVAKRLCWYLSSLIYFKYSNKIMSELNVDLARQAFKLNSRTYSQHDTGTFVQRIVEDPVQIVEKLSDVIDMVVTIITGVIMLIYIMTLNVWISIAFVVLGTIAVVIEFQRVKVKRRNKWVVRRKNDKVHSLTTEIIRSEKDIKSLGLENRLSTVSGGYYEDYRNRRYKLDLVDMNFWSSRNAIISIGVLFILVLGIWLMDKGLLTLASFMIVYSNRDSLWDIVYNSGNIANTFVTIKICHKRMFSLFDEEEFVTEKFGNLTFKDDFCGEIEFKNVSYSFKEFEYKELTADDIFKKKKGKNKYEKPAKKLLSENKIFENLSFKIQPNTTVAFVGKSGSGKSTILNLMSKMYEVDGGEVLIDNININDLSKETLRKSISLVNQFPYIFDMTIKENLLLAKENATDEELDFAIKQASLKEFIDTLPQGIETRVGESGIKLSGGQKQRLAIARALLRNSPIIIFDESTSSLDNFAQGEIKKSIDNLKGKSTVVIVAHRLSTIRDVDKIFFLDEGKIIDTGTFDELFEKNEKFKTMFLAENI